MNYVEAKFCSDVEESHHFKILKDHQSAQSRKLPWLEIKCPLQYIITCSMFQENSSLNSRLRRTLRVRCIF